MSEHSLSVGGRLRERIRKLRERARKALPFLSGMLAALLALFLYNTFSPGTKPLSQNEVSTAIFNVMASATPRPAYSEQVYKIIQPSLVWIQTDGAGVNGKAETGLGTGVIINRNGDILTALHVVDHATTINVIFADGTRSTATLSNSQPEKDIAVLQAQNLPQPFLPATLGNPRAMQVGDEAYVVGNPFGLYSSMSAGVISGFDRSFQPQGRSQTIDGLIQIDAAVNPGNSGGPLLNRNGQVVGVVTGIVNPTNQNFFVGIGFAVPIDIAAGGAGLPPY